MTITEAPKAAVVRATRQGLLRQNIGIVGVLALILVVGTFFSVRSPYFLNLDNFLNIVRQQAPTLIIAVGVTYVIVTKGIDLSVGSIAAVAGCTGAVVLASSGVLWFAIASMLVSGALIGALNGYLIAYRGMPAFIVTLAGLTGFQGVALLITGGGSVPISDPFFGQIGQGNVLGLPVPALIAIVVTLIGWFVFARSRFGMRVVATGSNKVGARRSGVPTARVLMAVYVISGGLAGLAGLIIAARLGAGSSNTGQTLALEVVTGIVLGGTSLFGGRGSVIGSMLGVMLLGIITNGLTLLQMNPFYVPIVQGGILLLALFAQSMVGLQSEDE